MGSCGEAVVQRRLVEQAREVSVRRESGGGWKVVVEAVEWATHRSEQGDVVIGRICTDVANG